MLIDRNIKTRMLIDGSLKARMLIRIIPLLFFLVGCQSQNKSDNTFTGYDMEGKKQSCPPMQKDIACTMMMAPSDFFAMECKDQGLKAFQCGCHYWLCEKPINTK